MPRIISLTTDFGNVDGYVGIVKAVILSIAPDAVLVDVSHDLPSWSIPAAAWIIANAFPHFPEGSVHLLVVDPGVGSSRRAIALSNGQHHFVGPDNGSLDLVFGQNPNPSQSWRAFELENEQYFRAPVSSTFHARDIYGPVCAHLANGLSLEQLGRPVELSTLARLDRLPCRTDGSTVEGEIVHIDKFGNLITNIPLAVSASDNAKSCFLDGRLAALLSTTYSSVEPGAATAFKGSHGYLEIAVFQGRADLKFGARLGSSVTLVHGYTNKQ